MSKIGERTEIFHNISSHQSSYKGGRGKEAILIFKKTFYPSVLTVLPSVSRLSNPPVYSCSYQRCHVRGLWNR